MLMGLYRTLVAIAHSVKELLALGANVRVGTFHVAVEINLWQFFPVVGSAEC